MQHRDAEVMNISALAFFVPAVDNTYAHILDTHVSKFTGPKPLICIPTQNFDSGKIAEWFARL